MEAMGEEEENKVAFVKLYVNWPDTWSTYKHSVKNT